MNKAAELYDRAALCHQRAANALNEAEKKGWFELACTWLILADSVSARIDFGPAKEHLELTTEEMISPTAARAIVSIGRASGRRAPKGSRPLASAPSSP